MLEIDRNIRVAQAHVSKRYGKRREQCRVDLVHAVARSARYSVTLTLYVGANKRGKVHTGIGASIEEAVDRAMRNFEEHSTEKA